MKNDTPLSEVKVVEEAGFKPASHKYEMILSLR